MSRRPKQGRTALYHLPCHAGTPLYIGISNSPDLRLAQHAADKDWWPQVDQRAVTVRWYPTRDAALRAERAAIRRHRPRYNIQHHPDRRSRYAPERPTSASLPSKVGWVGAIALVGDFFDWWQMSGQLTAAATVVTVGAVLLALGSSSR